MALIMVTNDDGISAKGLWLLVEAVQSLGEVAVFAPAQDYSWAGRSHRTDTVAGETAHKTVLVEETAWRTNVAKPVVCYAVHGSPAISAAVGVSFRRPGLVVSGINNGYNTGAMLSVSGTVGAALEAASSGIPAVAFSSGRNIRDETAIVAHVRRIVEAVLAAGFPDEAAVLNVNIPEDADGTTESVLARTCASSSHVQVADWKDGCVDLTAVHEPWEGGARSDRAGLNDGFITYTFLPKQVGLMSPGLATFLAK